MEPTTKPTLSTLQPYWREDKVMTEEIRSSLDAGLMPLDALKAGKKSVKVWYVVAGILLSVGGGITLHALTKYQDVLTLDSPGFVPFLIGAVILAIGLYFGIYFFATRKVYDKSYPLTVFTSRLDECRKIVSGGGYNKTFSWQLHFASGNVVDLLPLATPVQSALEIGKRYKVWYHPTRWHLTFVYMEEAQDEVFE